MMIFLMGVLATWRITALLVYEGWSETVRYKAKAHMLGEDGLPITFWGRVLVCFWCTSLFVAAPITAICWADDWLKAVVVWLAMSGGAILLNHLCRINLYAERH